MALPYFLRRSQTGALNSALSQGEAAVHLMKPGFGKDTKTCSFTALICFLRIQR